VYAPAGLYLGAATPQEIALSVISQIVAVRRGGSASSTDARERSAIDALIRACEAESIPTR
jgi:xanthine/CO dehydrogenase XdhC/CoxF family maturation factor